MKLASVRFTTLMAGMLALSLSTRLPANDGPTEEDLLAGHPRPSYEDVGNIAAMEEALRKSLAGHERYSFSRAWWQWDRLRARYVDGGRKDTNAARILRAVFRGLILDRQAKLAAKGEGDLLYLFHTTLTGDKRESVLDVEGREVLRDLHGGGYHGGWGGAARMRIYEELVRGSLLAAEERARFKRIVHDSLKRRIVDFTRKHQVATNHAFGNAGGVAIALRLFPDAPQQKEARAWLERIWKHLSDFGGWKEWTYYPYGPIFLHGLVDLAEELGKLETEPELIRAIGRRCLGFVHGGGVRGNPNSYANATFPGGEDRQRHIYADPWNAGYFRVEQAPRDGHFWYRMAQHFRDPEYLWAAEQVLLGGRPPDREAPTEYLDACKRRFAWFEERGIRPRAPGGKSAVGYLSELKTHRIPERLYLCPGRQSGKPFASFFVYDDRGSHLNPPEVWGTLYEYCVDGAKLLGSSGKYTDDIPGGSGAYDSLMVSRPDVEFPIHADGLTRSGRLDRDSLRAESRGQDSFGQYRFDDYFGEGSRWLRQVVLTAEGYLVVRDVYEVGKTTDGHQAGPCWQLRGDGEPRSHPSNRNWLDAPAWDHAWWQKQKKRVLVSIHPADGQSYGVDRHRTSHDISRSIPTDGFFARATVRARQPRVWLSVLLPFDDGEDARAVATRVRTSVNDRRAAETRIGRVTVTMTSDGKWQTSR